MRGGLIYPCESFHNSVWTELHLFSQGQSDRGTGGADEAEGYESVIEYDIYLQSIRQLLGVVFVLWTA